MKRAALIITDADRITATARDDSGYSIAYWVADPSEQLLADLRLVCDLAWARAASIAEAGAVARVRAALAAEKGGEHE